jgi:hypothetical protein
MGSKQLRRLKAISQDRRFHNDGALLDQVRQAFQLGGCACTECRDEADYLRWTLRRAAESAEPARYWRAKE